jgi:hypothetical protein
MEKQLFYRQCPKCSKQVSHTNKKNCNTAIRKGRLCASCAAKAVQNEPSFKKRMAEYKSEARRGENNPFFGKKHSETSIAKMKQSKLAYMESDCCVYRTEEFKEKSKRVGQQNGMHGTTYYDRWVENYGEEKADRLMSDLRKRKSVETSGKNNPMYGRPAPQGSGNGWSGWYNGWYFRSIKELSYMIRVIEANNFRWRTAESRDLNIVYVDYDGRERTYRADFLIDEKILVEVKPRKLFDTPKNKRKKEAAIAFCKKNGYEYRMADVKPIDFVTMLALQENGHVVFLQRYQEKMERLRCKLAKNGN